MMRIIKKLFLVFCAVIVSNCASDGSLDYVKATVIGIGLLSAATLNEDDIKKAASLSAKELDKNSVLAKTNSAYAKRLAQITNGLQNYSGLKLNFRVYVAKDVNAFAMADGTVRVYSGLMDAMPDDQLLAVIGHEIGHVQLKHSYKQMREVMLANSGFQALASIGGDIGKLAASELGAIAYQAVTARFSQKDELESDAYSVELLRKLGKDPNAMLQAVETLERLYGSGGGFLSSHPANNKRKEELRKLIASL